MKGLFDNTIGVLEQAIKLRSRRNTLLAGNIANVDTPGYRARDMKFRELMEKYMDKPSVSTLSVTDPAHLQPSSPSGAPVDLLAKSVDARDMATVSGPEGPLAITDPMHFASGIEEENPVVEITTETGTPNSVDLDREMAKLSANNLQYQAAVSALIKKFEGLMNAITEGGKQ